MGVCSNFEPVIISYQILYPVVKEQLGLTQKNLLLLYSVLNLSMPFRKEETTRQLDFSENYLIIFGVSYDIINPQDSFSSAAVLGYN